MAAIRSGELRRAFPAAAGRLAKALYPGNVPFSFSMGDGWQTIRIDRASLDISRIRFHASRAAARHQAGPDASAELQREGAPNR